MNPDEFDLSAFDDIVLSTGTTMDDAYTIDINDYTTSTVDISSITASTITSDDWVFETTRDKKRTALRNSGDIPVDIWAKMYNNRVIGTDDD
jgi:hypothetical protein